MIEEKTADLMVSFFEKLLEFYQKFLEFEKEKQGYLKNEKLNRLDKCMKMEQAYVLRARGLEQERMKLMQQTPNPKARFRELISQFPESRRDQMQKMFQELSSVLTELKKVNSENNLLAERKLRLASVAISKLSNQPELQKIYSKKIQSGSPPPAFLSKKI